MSNYKKLGISEFDLEMRLNDMEERSREKREAEEERKLYEKAVKKDKENMKYLSRAFPYITEEHLLNSIRALYPELNELFIIDLDLRDSNKVPLIKAKNLRPLSITHRRTYQLQDCEAFVHFRMVLAVIENGEVYIKSAHFRNGYFNR